MQWRTRWGTANGRMGERASSRGRAKNSARPRLGFTATPIRAGFEPRAGRDTARENQTRLQFLSKGLGKLRHGKRLKTGAEQRKQQKHQERAEFFALPPALSTTPTRPFASFAHSPFRPLASALTSPQQRDGSVLQSDFVDGAGTFPLVGAGENHVDGRLRL